MNFILALLLSLSCFGMGSRRPAPTPAPVPPVENPGPIGPVSTDYLTIRKCTNCSVAEWKFIQEAQVKTNETVASTCFASFMLQRKLIQTMGRTNKEVVDSLVGKNTEIDVEMYWTAKRVLGYTLADQPVGKYMEWINRRYMMSWNRCDLASLLGHETGHKKGYGHDYYYSPPRDYSVPYSINAAIDQCCVRF